ncbi:MAG: WbqC family protein [Muribaculaceae bacterium]
MTTLPGSQTTATPFNCVFAGSISYYARMLRAGTVCFDTESAVTRRDKSHNHCHIIDANGPISLTIPIERPAHWHGYHVRDMRISEHGDWRHTHLGAIFSAYGKAPFFEYIAPDLKALYERGDRWLVDFNMAMHNLIVDFLDLPITTVDTDGMEHSGVVTDDYAPCHAEYYQIWAQKHGFASRLSILDLLMNTGREAIFTLKAICETLHTAT